MAKVKHPTGKNRAKILSGLDYVDYKEPILSLFTDIYGRIVARRYTGLPVKKHGSIPSPLFPHNAFHVLSRSGCMGLAAGKRRGAITATQPSMSPFFTADVWPGNAPQPLHPFSRQGPRSIR